jgi:dienelactone hydrolase
MWLLLLIACSPLGPAELVVPPDPARPGDPGLPGPYGAAARSLAVQARVTEVVPAEVLYPSDADGELAVTSAPAVVLVHGGLVAPERYRWLGAHLATRGVVVVMPEAELLLAISQPGNGAASLDALREVAGGDGPLAGLVDADGPVATMGHSLGGVMAARQWVDDPDVDLLVLLASYAAPGDPVEDQDGRPVLAVGGTTDGSLEPDRLLDEVARFPQVETFLVDGMNHYAWTDDPSQAELDGDGARTRSLEALRRDALRVVDTWLDVVLGGADPAALAGPVPGTVTP